MKSWEFFSLIVGIIASIVAIIVFLTGKDSLNKIFRLNNKKGGTSNERNKSSTTHLVGKNGNSVNVYITITFISIATILITGRYFSKKIFYPNDEKDHTSNQKQVIISGDQSTNVQIGRDGKVIINPPAEKDKIGETEKNLFALGVCLGSFPTKIIARASGESIYMGEITEKVTSELLALIKYPHPEQCAKELGLILYEAEKNESIENVKGLIQKLTEWRSPLDKFIAEEYRGIGYNSYSLGFRISPILRILLQFKLIEKFKDKGDMTSEEAKKLEQKINQGSKALLFDPQAIKFKEFVMANSFPKDITQSLNYIATADISERENRNKMAEELSKIGVVFGTPISLREDSQQEMEYDNQLIRMFMKGKKASNE